MKTKMSVGALVSAAPRSIRNTVHTIDAQKNTCTISTSYGDVWVRNTIEGATVVEAGTCPMPTRPLSALKSLDPEDELLLEANKSGWRYSTAAGASHLTPYSGLNETFHAEIPDVSLVGDIKPEVWLEALKLVKASDSIRFHDGALWGSSPRGMVRVRAPGFADLSFDVPNAAVALLLGSLGKAAQANLLKSADAAGVSVGPTTVVWVTTPAPKSAGTPVGGAAKAKTTSRVLVSDLVKALKVVGKGRCDVTCSPEAADMRICNQWGGVTVPVRTVSGEGFRVRIDPVDLVRRLGRVRGAEVGVVLRSGWLTVFHAKVVGVKEQAPCFIEYRIGTRTESLEDEVAS